LFPPPAVNEKRPQVVLAAPSNVSKGFTRATNASA
jgi:hypothetical protein